MPTTPTPPTTTAVAVTFSLNSTDLKNTPPYEITGCSGQITYSDKSSSIFKGWNAMSVGTPQAGGATFSLAVTDNGYSVSNPTSIANWALTFIPRGPEKGNDSPFSNNLNTLTGTGALSQNGGTFSLDIGHHKIKNAGNWDWMLMIQINVAGNQIHCYSSDPEMDVT